MQGLPTRVNLTPVKFNLLSSYFASSSSLFLLTSVVSFHAFSLEDHLLRYLIEINHLDVNYDMAINANVIHIINIILILIIIKLYMNYYYSIIERLKNEKEAVE